jgi:uncharacterized protein (DUF4415 family)
VSASKSSSFAWHIAHANKKINYSDAPFLPDAAWMKAATELPHTKQQITLRIDAEVLDFFQALR